MVKDLEAFMAAVQEDKVLQEKMTGIIKASKPEHVFANCNAVAAEMGYTITEDDVKAFADEHQAELDDAELDKVAGGVIGAAIAVGTYFVLVGLSIYSCVDRSKD